jgi:serine protease
MPNGEIIRRVIVKFKDTVDLPYEDGAEKHLERVGVHQWPELASRFKGIRLNRLFTAVSPDRIGELVDRASQRDRRYRPPNLLSFFAVDCLVEANPAALVSALKEWSQVETAYVDPLDTPPALTGTNPSYPLQTYLKPPAVAPSPQGGIDAEFAWLQPGGTGAGQKIVDVERGAKLDQADIAGRNIAPPLFGANSTKDGDPVHGASALCIVAAIDNNVGVVGIAHGLQEVKYSSQVLTDTGINAPVNRPDAVWAAIDHFTQAGDPVGRVLLLEVQLGSHNDPFALQDVSGNTWEEMPMETALADYQMIRLASALGIVVIEPSGNGKHDLDLFDQAGGSGFVLKRPGDRDDSGAIMVGASTSKYPYDPVVNGTEGTCFGSRVDCFAWGEDAATYVGTLPILGDLYGPFGGTSAAAAIVAGAALLVQGVAEAAPAIGHRLDPGSLRALLADPNINTWSHNPNTDRIGVMPNLKRIIQEGLQVAPDVYIRDNVNDMGAVNTGLISMSPDIIVRPAAVANPAVAFGPGTENDLMLGPTATPGQDNFVYVRVWNRSAVAAAAVTVTVFYAAPATLVMGDAWTPVGTPVLIPNVPANNVMTVSTAITWPAAQVPPAGHYCFVALVGNAQDPAPPRASFLNFDNFYAFIRNNNNVTWRNFDVVATPAPAAPTSVAVNGGDAYEFEFDAPGAYDSERTFQLVVGSQLPFGSQMLLEAPLDLLSRRLAVVEREGNRGRVSIGIYGRTTLPAVLFPAKSRSHCRLLVQVPRNRARDHEVYVSQLYEGFEVGRVTWRIVPTP